MKSLAKPFVVSVSLVSLAACGKEKKEFEPVHPNPPATPETISQNPPEVPTHTMNPPATTDAGPTTTPTADDRVDTSKYTKALNPKDAKGREVFKGWDGDKCFVELPWPKDKPRMPGMRAPSEDVTCPPEMAKKGWEACRGGWVSTTAKGDDCICVQWGNPPPLPKRIACP